MNLKLENGIIFTDPTPFQIEEALKSIEKNEITYLILERDENQFMQVALDQVVGFYIEYHNGIEKKHSKSINDFNSFETTLDTLINYSNRNIIWHSSHKWEILPNIGSSVNLRISLQSVVVLLGLLIVIGITYYKEQIENHFNFSLDDYHFYILIFGGGLTLPIFWNSYKRWESLDFLSKTYVVSAFATFILLLFVSICTMLGIGNL